MLNIPILGSYAVGLITLEQSYSPPIEQFDFPIEVGNNWLMNHSLKEEWIIISSILTKMMYLVF